MKLSIYKKKKSVHEFRENFDINFINMPLKYKKWNKCYEENQSSFREPLNISQASIGTSYMIFKTSTEIQYFLLFFLN